MESQIKASIIMKALDILGGIIHTQLSTPNLRKVRELESEYYEQLKKLSEQRKKLDSHIKEIERRIGKEREIKEREIEESEEKEVRGTACLACSKHHFSTVSAALNEAVRFARSEGIKNREVIRRIGIAIDELNILERIDLATDKITKLPENEREVAEWALKKARDIRHAIDAIKTPKDLEEAAGLAAEVRTSFLEKLFGLYKELDIDEIVKRVCGSLSEEKRKKCEQAIYSFINKEGNLGKLMEKLEKKKEGCITCGGKNE